ncbi:MAG: HAD-IC family P-type ATPase [Bdellovibrionota bacterium]
MKKTRTKLYGEPEASVFNIRKREGEAIVEIPFEEIQQGDRLLIPLGSIFPVACIAEQSVEIDLSWINGESTPVLKFVGELIPSGATLLGPHAVEVIADVEYHGAELAELLTQAQQKEMLPLLWQNFAKYYVIGVLSFVTIGFAFWFWKAGLHQAISVAVSIAVVTCPCSLGLAIPLARTLAYRILMFEGVLIQRSHTLDDMQKVQHVAFDKTGTLTMSDLHWRNLEVIKTIDRTSLSLLFSATSLSYHPASKAIFEALRPLGLDLKNIAVQEKIGEGLFFAYQGDNYKIGRGVNQAKNQYTVVVYKNDGELMTIYLDEVLQEDIIEVIAYLYQKQKQVYVISGDAKDRVQALAKNIGITSENVFADKRPKEKAAIIEQMPSGQTLYIGDGLNDQLAIQGAFVSALSLNNQLQFVQRANMYFLSQSMRWLPKLIEVAGSLQKTITFNLIFLFVYNASTVSLAMLGKINPLFCALIMPLSSIFVIGVTVKKMQKLM